ncbi:MAG: DUF1553 domain-containing protein [Planctomycetes bacterium]|nr:DUF1553 domain-containing protein [Planctomycetota bacterium]
MRFTFSTLLPLLLAAPIFAAPEAKGLGDPGALQSLAIESGRAKDGTVVLAGRDAMQQLLVIGKYSTGQTRDLTRNSQFTASPADIVRVDSTGFIVPLKEGKTTIQAVSGTAKASIQIEVTNIIKDIPVHFVNQVVPIFTKFSCNSGGCHGKADGQNGFKLSLLGFEPLDDFEYLVKEARGRRVFATSPEYSLLLRKATGQMAHGGGKKLEYQSPFYTILKRWVEQGAPLGKPGEGAVVHIEVLPKELLLDRKGQQQLIVIAHHTDGTTTDVTRMAQFESNHTELAEVGGSGLVSAKSIPGSAAIMVRFQSHVDVFRATVPLGAPITDLPKANNFIDELVFKRLKALGLPPSELCDDSTFVRRVMLDIAGRLPTRLETEAFLADRTANKREKLIDTLLDGPDYPEFFANKWSAVLRNRRKTATDDLKPTQAFHDWIRDSIKENKPYDKFVREILTVKGEEIKDPPVVWYRELKESTAQMEDTAQLFLGQRLACAKCHHHPFEKWSQHDYWSLTAFFTNVVVKEPKLPKKLKDNKIDPGIPATVTMKNGTAEIKNPRTNKLVKAAGLGCEPVDMDKDADPREQLADWMVDPKNPFFGKALANRYWKHFMGRGLIDPEDDMRVTNPASNPELLDALAQSFIDSKYDLRKLVRTICLSRSYQLSAIPNAFNADDRQNHSRFLPKRLNAEVLLDAIDDVTATKSSFKGVTGLRAVQLPDNLFDSYFLSVFGRPDSASACECERNSDASLAQALHMFNSQEILAKVAGARAANMAKDSKKSHEERLTELYLVAFSRKPSAEEIKSLTGYIEQRKGKEQTAYEDILWALINTKEFLFNH